MAPQNVLKRERLMVDALTNLMHAARGANIKDELPQFRQLFPKP